MPNRKQAFLEIYVQDNGIGISEDDQKRLFKLFGMLESTNQINSKGIGLGLHITKKIINMFDGEIICQSTKGSGSTFIFLVALPSEDTSASSSPTNTTMHRFMSPHKRKY